MGIKSIFSGIFGHDNGNPDVTTTDKPQFTETTTTADNSPVEVKEESKQDVNQADTNGKALIYNLIIIDESGSMSMLRNTTLSGVNEVIGTIRSAQQEFGDKQQHYITLVTFDSRGDNSVRTLIDARPIQEVSGFANYNPRGCTPLYDAMGQSLTRLRQKVGDNENASCVVTVLTDGMENASHEWNAKSLRKLIEQLKEEGWSFSYMGSAHDVKEVTDLLSIDNVVEFSHDLEGARSTWARESSSRRAYYSKMRHFDIDESIEEKRMRKRSYANEYYEKRVTPEHIETLEPGEIFVFGSNKEGVHNGGAAAFALNHFGAIMGQGEGLQGHSYAIPTTSGMNDMMDAVMRFIQFAREHQETKFYVTAIGCGVAGYTPNEVAPLFREAIYLENVYLPESFWLRLGLRMNI